NRRLCGCCLASTTAQLVSRPYFPVFPRFSAKPRIQNLLITCPNPALRRPFFPWNKTARAGVKVGRQNSERRNLRGDYEKTRSIRRGIAFGVSLCPDQSDVF